MAGDRHERGCGDRDVARAHGRLQGRLSLLRTCWDEDVEARTNAVAAEAAAVLHRLAEQADELAAAMPTETAA